MMNSAEPANPFTYTGAQPPDELIDRDSELERLAELARSGQHVRLQAPRGFGKTTLIGALARKLREEGLRVAYSDLHGVLTAADLADRLAEAYESAHRFGTYALEAPFAGPARRRLRQLRRRLRGAGAGPVSFELSEPDAVAVLREVLDLPREHAEGSGEHVVCVFDEFQAILAAPGELDAVIRSRIQHHAGVSYLFAGSQPTLLRELFERRERAFYAQTAPVTLDRLPLDELGGYLVKRFEATDRDIDGEALDAFLETVEGHPQRAMLLAHQLWRCTPSGRTADEDTLDAAIGVALDELADAHAEALDGLRSSHERFLALIAYRRRPYAADSLSAMGLTKGDAQSAERALVKSGRLERTDAGLRFADPLLAERLRRSR